MRARHQGAGAAAGWQQYLELHQVIEPTGPRHTPHRHRESDTAGSAVLPLNTQAAHLIESAEQARPIAATLPPARP